ncbi:MAG: cell division protein ZipA C-terminal FtsZ-binding domain-containing protein [Propionivibrio sp.]|uniref:cell division protein ZipA C-terminal FtsZ-binding domain-containing protein n=1 Tax=Propionivibrio sp. TaxID=2212460 RepID=UPI001A3A9A01|nr:cell division protein ZipA C-terminal FtsZ-binding domain-containing protein [Propionivibrio sp.]MBL8415676.1 cell division protein ZipA C-terminal FtsZ-binding domain-containing protein [Propionivibrio sp.]
MTELQLGLIGLGGAAIVGVVAYNKWQDYRHRKLAEQLSQARHTDVLLDQPDVGDTGAGFAKSTSEVDGEPDLSVTPATVSSPEIDANAAHPSLSGERIELRHDLERQEPTLLRLETSADPDLAPDHAPDPASGMGLSILADQATRDIAEPHHLLSPLIDYVAAFETVEPAPAYQILEAQREVLARIRKPVHWIGYNELSREWEPIVDDVESEYRHIRVGLQLVDRRGPLDDSDLSVFHIAMQDLAAELMAITDLPTRQPALDGAAKLDAFCASVDIQIGINVISQGQAFPGTKLRALAEAAGMAIDGEGRFVRSDDEGNILFVLLNAEAPGFSAESMKTMSTHGLTFLLDVPRVAHGERVFNQMLDLARRFADVLRGALVDDNHHPLSEGALEPIRRQVAQYQSIMAAQGLPAGAPLTQRLFS